MYKAPQLRTACGNSNVEKVCAVAARSTFGSQNVQSTSASDHLWKFRCRKSVRRCGAKHMWKPKCTKHAILYSQTAFGSWDVEKVHAFVARSTFSSQNVQSTSASGPLLGVEMSKKRTPLWREAHLEVKKCQKLRVLDFFDVQMSKKPLTNLTNLTHLANLTNLTNLANTTNRTYLSNLTNLTNITNSTNLIKQTNKLTNKLTN